MLTHLGRRTAALHIDPESGNIYQKPYKSYGKEFHLQVSSQNLQQQLDLGLQDAANQHDFGQGLLLLLLLAAGH